VAPSTDITVVTIIPWPLFQSFVDGLPNIGGKLYGYVPSTSTPKVTYADPWLTVPNAQPVVMDDQGSATVYLRGLYDLRLYDAEDVLLWSVDAYSFVSSAPPPDPGEKIVGSADIDVTPSPGTGVISIPSLVPAGFRCEGLTWTITTAFGTSGGLTGILLGDAIANDRWAHITDLSAGQSGGQVSFRSDTTPVEPIPYVILASALGGNYDAVGGLHVTAYFSALPADVP
jgi:hypothetical protein